MRRQAMEDDGVVARLRKQLREAKSALEAGVGS
jgi:hypothetical protein